MLISYLALGLLAIACLWLTYMLQQLKNVQKQHADKFKRVEKELHAAALINQTLGNRLFSVEAEAKRLEAQQKELEDFGKNDLFQQRTFKQASKMAQLGASIEELKRSCELSEGEAQLLRHLNHATDSRTVN
ncbi:MAG: DUF2802 domain-containing protein [Enterobacterales bacterium]|nr:DUF2802 domain-containing protein [Enterobacterales bacterium]